MGLNDTLSNTLSKINNAEKLGKRECIIKPVSKTIKRVLEVMNKHQYIGDYKKIQDEKGNFIVINLIGKINKCNAIKPRFSVKMEDYEKFEKRFLPAKDFGIMLVSTPLGVMTHIESKKKKIGGKLLSYCY